MKQYILSIQCACIVIVYASTGWAAEYNLNPSNYQNVVSTLQPGDYVNLSAGSYENGLSITDIVGTSEAPITISGPESGAPAIFYGNASRNTVSIRRSAHVAIRYLTIDGENIPNIDAIKAEGDSGNWSHHITIEYCTITGHDANQQTPGISTKATSWDWIIRHNTINSAGTGLYLGNSNGEAPFIRGIIEYNLVLNPEGYCMEIKHQNPRTVIAGMPADGSVTIIRHNVFIKDDDPSGSGDRPNLLVGHFPASGAGLNDRYEIYGNLFYHNPREALFQGAGNIHLHDNLFIDSGDGWPAVNIRRHNDESPKDIVIYNNTIFGADTGITVTGVDSDCNQIVVGNAIFASTPLYLASDVTASDNIVDSVANAAVYLTNPSSNLETMDFYPATGQLQSSVSLSNSLSSATDDTDHNLDFNGTVKLFTYIGAYQGGAADNPGWQLNDSIKAVTDTGGDSYTDESDEQGLTDDDTVNDTETTSEGGGSSGGGCFVGSL